jgi:transcriptional regulator with XRE-family HTH domain
MPLDLHDRLRLAASGRSNRLLSELTGVPTETVRRYMRGQTPSAEFLARFCTALDLTADWLLLGRGEMRTGEAPELTEAELDDVSLAHIAERVESLSRILESLERRAHAIGRKQIGGRAIAG